MKNWLFTFVFLVLFLLILGGIWYLAGETGNLFQDSFSQIESLRTDLDRAETMIGQMQNDLNESILDLSDVSTLVKEQDRLIENLSIQLSQ